MGISLAAELVGCTASSYQVRRDDLTQRKYDGMHERKPCLIVRISALWSLISFFTYLISARTDRMVAN